MNEKPLILIVDDEPFNVDYLEQELEDLDYDTISAGDGRAALAQVEAQAPDMILLDIMMPLLDGFGVLKALQADKQWRDIPVVVISAMNDMDSVVRGIELGADDYLPKPFDPTLLAARLKAGLERKRLRDQEVEYLQQVAKLTDAATAVQANNFDESQLKSVAERTDALGTLAQVFQRMAQEVHAREQRLRQQIQQLRLDMEEQRRAANETADIYIPMDRRQALAKGESLPEWTSGTALFADISGFTPLTAAFAADLGKQRGAEEMTRQLKQVFTALIAEVHNFGGSVIGFSGDAITCWFAGASGLRAVACALAMQTAMGAFTNIITPSGSIVSLGLKVAVADGSARRFLVGNPEIQRVEVLAGRPLDVLAKIEKMAEAGKVVVVGEMVTAQMVVAAWRGEGKAAVVTGLTEPVALAPWPTLAALPDEQVRPWLLAPAYHMIRNGTSQFMAELRPAHALFLQFFGLDYDNDEQVGARLDKFLRWVQGVVDHYGGYVLQVTTGDKGSYLYASFGALAAHEDDAVRATLAALDLQQPPEMPFISRVQIGVASGQMYTGAYGSPARRTYGVLGDKTNMAARLMVAAVAGILCDETVYGAARARVAFEVLPPIMVKGKSEPMAVFRPTAVKPGTVHHSMISKLSPTLQLTLKVASVMGSVFSLEGLTAIYPVEAEKEHVADHVQALLTTGLVVQRGPEYAFADAFIQQTAYQLMLFAQRRPLHRALASWYEQTITADPITYYTELAHHWQQAEDSTQAIYYLEKAGEQARQQGDFERAMRLYNEALKLEAETAV